MSTLFSKRVQPANLAQIVSRAASLEEILQDPVGTLPFDSRLAEDRLIQWRAAAGNDNLLRFERRLEWDGLQLETLRLCLGAAAPARSGPLPEWATFLAEVCDNAFQNKESSQEMLRLLDSQPDMHFQELLTPLVAEATLKLRRLCPEGLSLLEEEAFRETQRKMLRSLYTYSHQALELEFEVYAYQNQSIVDGPESLAGDPANQNLYYDFVRQMSRTGLITFFQEYAVLARLLAVIALRWVENTAEFLTRLSQDLPALSQLFGETEGKVRSIETAVSDPHNGRKTVTKLTFASGLKLVYKPRGLAIDSAFQHFLTFLNRRDPLFSFRTLKILDRGAYGWVELVQHGACASPEEAARYFKRAGHLLGLIYVLGGTDCHMDNLIASGEYPVLVDTETLLQPKVREIQPENDFNPRLMQSDALGDSVLRTGLLPVWYLDPESHQAYDISALGNSVKIASLSRDTNGLRVTSGQIEGTPHDSAQVDYTNRPRLADAPLSLTLFTREFIQGFREMYDRLFRDRVLLLSSDTPLDVFRNHEVRYLIRPTQVYATILNCANQPSFQREGIDQSIQLDLLARTYTASPIPPPAWAFVKSERESLRNGDIPLFFNWSESHDLVSSTGGKIENYFCLSGYDAAVENLRTLSPEGLEIQVRIIHGALAAYAALDNSETSTTSRTVARGRPESVAPSNLDRLFLEEAERLAQELFQKANRGSKAGGALNWLAPRYYPSLGRYQLGSTGTSLYDGYAGIALFLAALYAETSNPAYRVMAEEVQQTLLQHLTVDPLNLDGGDVELGGADGLPSILYALVKISKFLGEPALLTYVLQLAGSIEPAKITNDTVYDVMSGSAGTILALLSLYESTRSSEALSLAIECGRHLLTSRKVTPSGYQSWPDFEGKFLTGFSHGAAGIALALLRLNRYSDPIEFEQLTGAALEAIRFEDSSYDPVRLNWPDFRQENQPAFSNSWCHGAPGIALARLAGLPHQDSDSSISRLKEILNGAEAAFTSRYDAPNSNTVDQLCCGEMGRVELKLSAALRLSWPSLHLMAREQAAITVQEARQRGYYKLYRQLPMVYNPGFFTGTSGIGYQLLRLRNPEKFPAVLLWE